MPRELPRHTTRHRRAVVGVLVAVVLAAVVGVGVALAVRGAQSPQDGGEPAATTARTPSPTADEPSPTLEPAPRDTSATALPTLSPTATEPAPPPAPAPEQPVGTSTAPPVAVGVPAPLADGVVATVRTVTAVRTVPQGPGDRAGPGVVVRLAVRNDSGGALDTAGLTVTATAAGAPAPPTAGGVAAPITGTLDEGEESSGTYVFRTATADATPVLVQVSLASSPGVVVVQQG